MPEAGGGRSAGGKGWRRKRTGGQKWNLENETRDSKMRGVYLYTLFVEMVEIWGCCCSRRGGGGGRGGDVAPVAAAAMVRRSGGWGEAEPAVVEKGGGRRRERRRGTDLRKL